MSTTKAAPDTENGQVKLALGIGQTGTDSGKWMDFSGFINGRFTVSGTISGGTYDVLGCSLPDRPLDADNLHPSIMAGLPNNSLNFWQIEFPPNWVKLITIGLTGAISCGVLCDKKNGWNR